MFDQATYQTILTAVVTALLTAAFTGLVQFLFGRRQDRSRQFRELRAKYVAEFLDLAIEITEKQRQLTPPAAAEPLYSVQIRATRAGLFLSDHARRELDKFAATYDMVMHGNQQAIVLVTAVDNLRALLKVELARD